MMCRNSILFSIFCNCITAFLLPTKVYGTHMTISEQDPLKNINYAEAFNQTAIYQRFQKLLICLNNNQSNALLQNIFPDHQLRILHNIRHTMSPEIQLSYRTNELQNFQQQLLKQLIKARRDAILKPAHEAIIFLSLMSLATYGAINFAGEYGGSYSIFMLLYEAVSHVQDILKACIDLNNTPAHPIDELEKLFAINRCFIPNALWPIIIEKFMLARQNAFAQREAIDFLTFTLGITLYKPLPVCPFIHNIEKIIHTLETKIDTFFSQYQDITKEKIQAIKLGVAQFMRCLVGISKDLPHYQYLVGPSGIGKTHFVKALSQWIEEIAPGTVHVEDIIIHEVLDLDGNTQRPGALLKVLRNQLQTGKRGSIVFMDEATWLNKMPNECKRTFNGNLTAISTAYFGNSIDGNGVNIPMKPMLIFVASNEDITDVNLASRFAITQFPQPSLEARIEYGYDIFAKSPLYQTAERTHKITECKEKLREKITTDESIKSFRDVQRITEVYLAAHVL